MYAIGDIFRYTQPGDYSNQYKRVTKYVAITEISDYRYILANLENSSTSKSSFEPFKKRSDLRRLELSDLTPAMMQRYNAVVKLPPREAGPMNIKQTTTIPDIVSVEGLTLGQCIQTKSATYLQTAEQGMVLNINTLAMVATDNIEDKYGLLRNVTITIGQ